jgi:GGDEF domain-containing protein/Zn-finger nucleic acid-binding protein
MYMAVLAEEFETPTAATSIGVIVPPGFTTQTFPGGVIFHSISDLTDRLPDLHGLYLSGWSKEQAQHIVNEWRVSAYWFRPVFVSDIKTQVSAIDGVLEFEQTAQICERIEQLRLSLRLDPLKLQFDERLLYYLYLREPHDLTPICDRSSKHLYRYLEAEALVPQSDDTGTWIASLTRRNLLQTAKLIDRTRHCRTCSSAHLHYLDVCPQCRGIEIRASESVHCFTCGNVAPHEDFVKEGQLVCPKCQAKLRHVGVDYDKPLTKLACGTCHHAFIEAAVVVRCLDCNAVSEPDMLDVRDVHTLRLSPNGRAALRAGQLQESFAALDTANYVAPNYFRLMLDWGIVTQARHKELQFSLIMIDFINANEMIEVNGAARTFLILDELASRLRELLRNTDITTRTSETLLWVFLPFSSGAGFAARVERLLEEITPKNGATAVRAHIRHIETPGDLEKEEKADELMKRLQQPVEG